MKNFLLITLLFFFVSVYPCNHDNFIDRNEVRYFKVKDVDEYNQKLLRSSDKWKTFLEGHPQWFVVFDELSKLPNKAFGEPFSLYTNDPVTMLNTISGDHLSTYFSSNLDLRLEKDVNTKFSS